MSTFKYYNVQLLPIKNIDGNSERKCIGSEGYKKILETLGTYAKAAVEQKTSKSILIKCVEVLTSVSEL